MVDVKMLIVLSKYFEMRDVTTYAYIHHKSRLGTAVGLSFRGQDPTHVYINRFVSARCVRKYHTKAAVVDNSSTLFSRRC